MILDSLLAYFHHLCAFGLLGVLWVEMSIIRQPLQALQLRTLSRYDLIYGLLSAVMIIAGLLRLIWGSKDWSFYVGNPFFWLKMGVFLSIGLLSIYPTLKFMRWSKAQRLDAQFVPAPTEVLRVRKIIHSEFFLFASLPFMAALMARGIGY